ncbi:MAG: DUF1826 domain-containing protein [Saprospiraceae bacterium]|nr:DUF1826 domain-containing protein [Saprospiraceae bacterium]
MNVLRHAHVEPDQSARIVDAPEGLRLIHHAACPAVIWQREPALRFQRWIDALDPEHLPTARMTLRPDAVPSAIEHLCTGARLPEGYERGCLIGDISAMAHIFADIMGADYLALRLDVVASNACRKFHRDAITARLICTYRGTGTQYGLSSNDDDPAEVLTVPTGAPMILRGTEWPVSPA